MHYLVFILNFNINSLSINFHFFIITYQFGNSASLVNFFKVLEENIYLYFYKIETFFIIVRGFDEKNLMQNQKFLVLHLLFI